MTLRTLRDDALKIVRAFFEADFVGRTPRDNELMGEVSQRLGALTGTLDRLILEGYELVPSPGPGHVDAVECAARTAESIDAALDVLRRLHRESHP